MDIQEDWLKKGRDRYENPGVWDGAPENAIIAKVHFYKADKVYARLDGQPTVYTRTLPKTKEREIAERIAKENSTFDPAYTESLLADIIESALLEYGKS